MIQLLAEPYKWIINMLYVHLINLFSYLILLRPGVQTPGDTQVAHIWSIKGVNKGEKQELWQMEIVKRTETEQDNKTVHTDAEFLP